MVIFHSFLYVYQRVYTDSIFLWDIHLRPARIHLIHSESKILIDFAPCTLPHIQAGFPSP